METDVKSRLLSEEKDTKDQEYSDNEKKYLGNLLKRIEAAREERDKAHPEFDGMTYLQYCESNRKGANTYIEPKKNKADTNFASGTIRQKLFGFLAALVNLDLFPDVQAMDDDNVEVQELGEAMEDMIWETSRHDGEGTDDEKKMLRQYVLLEQGTVFVEDVWAERWVPKKTVTKEFTGDISSARWNMRLMKKNDGCVRRIVPNENVILGNIYEFEIKNQPFIATVDILSYDDAKQVYGKWTRWENVPRIVTNTLNIESESYGPFHWFETTGEDRVEVIKYYDIFNNEMQVLLNGIMMIPIGYPMWTRDGEYPLVKQVNEVISPNFAYGKSMVSRIKNVVFLLDEMYRLAIKKTQKSFAPPLANNTGQVFSSRIFDPGRVTSGIDPDKIRPIDPNARPVEGGEFNMIEMLQKNIDTSTLDPTFTGSQPTGSATATQILEVQRQAKLMVGLTVFVASLLEEKLAWRRIQNILQYWFETTGESTNEYTGEFIEKYRSVYRNKLIDGYGDGIKLTRLTKDIPTIDEQLEEEDALSEKKGKPVRITYLNPDDIKKAKYMWYITVTPHEKKSDALSKVLYDEMTQKAFSLFPNMANQQYFAEKFSEIWEVPFNKAFSSQEQAPTSEDMGSEQSAPAESAPAAGLPQPPNEQNNSALLDLIGKTGQ